MNNDSIRRLSSGRVVIPLTYSQGDLWSNNERKSAEVIYSDDDCITWQFSGYKIELPMRGVMEPFIAEIYDGRLIMVMRNQLGSVFKAYSADQGLTWSKPQTTGLKSPESCPFIINVPNSRKLLIIWNNAEYDMHWRSHYGKRTPLTAAVTEDGGQTFTDFWNIETDPAVAFTNPGASWTKDGRCILTYWSCTYTQDGIFHGRINLNLASFCIDEMLHLGE